MRGWIFTPPLTCDSPAGRATMRVSKMARGGSKPYFHCRPRYFTLDSPAGRATMEGGVGNRVAGAPEARPRASGAPKARHPRASGAPLARLQRSRDAPRARLLCACTLRIPDQPRFNRPLPYQPFASVITILTRVYDDCRHPCVRGQHVTTCPARLRPFR